MLQSPVSFNESLLLTTNQGESRAGTVSGRAALAPHQQWRVRLSTFLSSSASLGPLTSPPISTRSLPTFLPTTSESFSRYMPPGKGWQTISEMSGRLCRTSDTPRCHYGLTSCVGRSGPSVRCLSPGPRPVRRPCSRRTGSTARPEPAASRSLSPARPPGCSRLLGEMTGLEVLAVAPALSSSTRVGPSPSMLWTGAGAAPRDGLTLAAPPGEFSPGDSRQDTCTESGHAGSRVLAVWPAAKTFTSMSSLAATLGTRGSSQHTRPGQSHRCWLTEAEAGSGWRSARTSSSANLQGWHSRASSVWDSSLTWGAS